VVNRLDSVLRHSVLGTTSNKMKITIKTEKETKKLAEKIANQLKGGEVIALSGELGAGKTTFTQYLAKALGVKGNVNSPTFVLMKIYKTNKHPLTHFVHMDAYRISSAKELEEFGLDEYIGQPHAIVVIEWAEKVGQELRIKNKEESNRRVIWIKISLKNETRVFNITRN
jgi:tRNA threonylcarbamoyladenosine biosynthesis protein TsaE